MLLIDQLTVVTMDKQRRILTDAAIVIDRKIIAAVGKSAELTTKYAHADRLDGHGMVAIPGLIDAHCHADQSLLRGLGDKMHWIPFLDDVVEPWLVKRDPADGVLANTLAMIEMLRGGTTCFVSPNVDPRDDYESLTAVIGQLGIRAVLGRFIVPAEGSDTSGKAQQAVGAAVKVMQQWHASQHGLVSMWFGLMVPRAAGDTVHPLFYREVAIESARMGVGIVYHFCSEPEDAEYIVNEFGMRPAEWSRDHHALGKNVLLINGCQVTPHEIGILASTGTHLVHSPVANMKMATGILPLPDLLAAGVNVALGTDGALNNNSYDMFAEMKTACLLQNAVRKSASAMTAETALEMATLGGARAIHREHELGSIEPGKLADIVLVDMNRTHTLPIHDVVSNLVFCTNNSNVHTVFVGGRKVVDAGTMPGVDVADVLQRASARSAVIRQQLGVETAGAWPVS
ncbi:MAG: amidohydrolase [Gammaproteobacteria bacterium]|nr:amidohydrolase [Gammaproteobacteria bacterium]MDH5321761.1 amidohydrolase [Gammaproteobacteria bacterium]